MMDVESTAGRGRLVCIAFAAILSAAFIVAAVPAASAVSNYRTYPTCLISTAKPKADSSCSAGDGFGAVLISKRRQRLHYRFCWREPSGDHHCVRKAVRHRRRASKVRLYNRAFRHPTGTWRLVWKHGGRIIDRDRLHVASEGV
jgi:hypothetical protein